MKPTPEQVEAAKAWTKCDESSRQYALLLGSHTHDSMGRIAAEILLAALDAAEQDSARLDWLLEHCEWDNFKIATSFSSPWEYYLVEYDQSGNAIGQTPHFSTARAAIDAARKAQPLPPPPPNAQKPSFAP